MLIDAGALALSQDISAQEFQPKVGFGTSADPPARDLAVIACSQEHGFVQSDDLILTATCRSAARVRVLLASMPASPRRPMTANYVVDSELDGGKTVVDITAATASNGW